MPTRHEWAISCNHISGRLRLRGFRIPLRLERDDCRISNDHVLSIIRKGDFFLFKISQYLYITDSMLAP